MVAHFGTRSNVGKRTVPGNLAFIPQTTAGTAGSTGIDHGFEGFGRNTKIGDFM